MNASSLEHPWPRVPLGDLLNKSDEAVSLQVDRKYKEVTVRLWGRGVVLRGERLGGDIAGRKRNLVRGRQFLFSRIDARNGAFGLVPDSLDGAVVSSDFPAFNVNEDRLLPEFLEFYTQRRLFAEEARRVSKGTTNRVRLREDGFYRLEIPLPSIPEQKRIVARVQLLTSKSDEVRELRNGVQVDRIAALRSLFRQIIDGAPLRPMSEIAPLERRPVLIKVDESYPELGIRSFGRGTFHKPILQGSDLTWQKLFRIHSGDIVLSNIKAWEGAIGVATEADHNRVGSHRYLTCVVDPDIATAGFVCFYLLTREGLEQIGRASPGSADRNRTLGMGALMNIHIPVPPLPAQHRFGQVHRRMMEVVAAGVNNDMMLDAMMPSVLDRAFKGEIC